MDSVETITLATLRAQQNLTIDEDALLTAFRSLTIEQADTLAQWALQRYDAQPDSLDWQVLLGKIACFVDGGLRSVYADLLVRELFWPGAMYRDADPASRDHLIQQVEEKAPDSNALNDLLLCLAWIGDEIVSDLFHSWREQPPTWRTALYNPPESYAVEAGWELTPAGERRNLYYVTSYELVPTDGATDIEGVSPVRAAVTEPAAGTACGWCGRTLRILFALDLRDSRLAFLGLSGTSLPIARCDFCSPYATVFTDVDFEGSVRWSASNGSQPADFESGWAENPLVGRQLVLGPRRRTSAETVGCYQSAHNSEFGGHPDWIQDAEYPKCPQCQRRMTFIGQVETDDVIENAEGITYAFLCAQCGKAATTYQQT